VERLEVHVVPVSAKTTWLFLELRLSNGVHGWGEVTDFGNETAIATEVGLIEAALLENAVGDLAGAFRLMEGRQASQARRVVRSGLEQAWLDADARCAGVPLARYLGGFHRQAVPVYANINRGIAASRSPEDFAAQARLAVADGYRAIKIAPFDGFHWRRNADRTLTDKGILRIAAVREAIGPDVELFVDCHSRLDPAAAIAVLHAVAPSQPYWLEDVLGNEFGLNERRAIRHCAHRRGIRIAGGEEIGDLADFLAFIEGATTDVVLPDLRLTGVRTGMTICEVAASRGQVVSLHNPVGPVLDGVSRHVAAALADFFILERPVRESPLWEELRSGATGLVDGSAAFEAAPGLGFDLKAGSLPESPASETFGQVLSFRGMPGAGPDA
jgi:galactonate dehydratase